MCSICKTRYYYDLRYTNEFYPDGGCVGIGRATGGTVEQIVPLWAARACSTAVCSRAAPFHSMSSHPTGILFRERDDIPTALDDWKGINDTNYNKHGGPPTRVQERGNYPLFKAMAAELRIAIEDGIRIFTREPELYYRMLVEGIVHIQRTFSWYRAAQEYVRYLT